MDKQILTLNQKNSCCKLVVSPVQHEYLLTLLCKFFIDLIPDFFSFTQLELTCEIVQNEKFPPAIKHKPPQRKIIQANTAFIKGTTRFAWLLHSNQHLEDETILNAVNISYECLEN